MLMTYSELKNQILNTAKEKGLTLKFSHDFGKLLKKIKDNQ